MPTTNGMRRLAILAFHKIGEPSIPEWRTWSYIAEDRFADYLQWLSESGWRLLDLQAFLQGLADPDSLPERSLLLTFDDGYKSMRTIALPWLKRFGYPAVLFVPTQFIGKRNDFDTGVEPEEVICDWDDLRELDAHGVSIQSHSALHRGFSTLPSSDLEFEIFRSKAMLEIGLQKPVEFFAYPYGDSGADKELVEKILARAGYHAACLYEGGPNPIPVTNPFQLMRIAMGPDTDLESALA
jgi:peptidoglycan/xylan/chitin deacetylase (PgdA/CDA1 family)